MPWPAVLPAPSQPSCCPCTSTDPRRGLLRARTRLGLPLAWGGLQLSGGAAGCFSRDADTFPRKNRHPGTELPSRVLYFCPPWTKGRWDVSQGCNVSPGVGCLPRGTGRVPILSQRRLPPSHPLTQSESRSCSVFRGGGGEAKQNQAGYFKPDLISPLSLPGPALATLPHPCPRQLPFSGVSPAALSTPPTPVSYQGAAGGSCSQARWWDR